MLLRKNIAAKAMEAGGKLRVRSALNPILWLCAIVTIPSVVLIPFIYPPPGWYIVALICAPIAVALFGFVFLLFFDRDKLQSEDYQIRKYTLELMQQKGEVSPRPIDPSQVIETPPLNLLKGGEQ